MMNNRIIFKKNIAQNIYLIEIISPQIAKKSLPGQFIILLCNSTGERIPLTVVDKNIEKGTITLVFQVVGKTTQLLSKLNQDDTVEHLVGPLGNPTEIKKYGNVITIGGGVGIAEILPVSKGLKNIGNKLTCIIGTRTKEQLFFEQELRQICDEIFVTTNDGSYGIKGFVSDVLENILKTSKPDIVYAVGPIPMMRVVSDLTKKYNVYTTVSLNPIMVDGTGMCGSCRVTVDGKTKFACVDGPEFDAHKVDWKELENRTKQFVQQEKCALEYYEKRIKSC